MRKRDLKRKTPTWAPRPSPGLFLLPRGLVILLLTLFLSSDEGTFFPLPYLETICFSGLFSPSKIGLCCLVSEIILFLFWSQPGKDIGKARFTGVRREVGGELQF